jgi:hypothetical protein
MRVPMDAAFVDASAAPACAEEEIDLPWKLQRRRELGRSAARARKTKARVRARKQQKEDALKTVWAFSLRSLLSEAIAETGA